MECFNKTETKIHETCQEICGNYSLVKKHVGNLKSNLKNDHNTTMEISKKYNEACKIFKCMTRCQVNQTKIFCGDNSGNSLQSLVQDILNAQREDIENLNIVEHIVHTTPPECGYHHNPKIMFDVDEDEKVMNEHPVDHVLKPKNDLLTAKDREDVLALIKQFKTLSEQTKELEKEKAKLNLEIQSLKKQN